MEIDAHDIVTEMNQQIPDFLCLLRYLQWPISEQNYSDALQAGSEENITQALDWKRVVRTANVLKKGNGRKKKIE